MSEEPASLTARLGATARRVPTMAMPDWTARLGLVGGSRGVSG